MKTKSLMVMFAFLFSFLLVSTQSSFARNSKIIGKWYFLYNQNINIEYFSDNTLQYKGYINGFLKSSVGEWVVLDDGRLKATINLSSDEKILGLGRINDKILELELNGKKLFTKEQDESVNYLPLKKGFRYDYSVIEETQFRRGEEVVKSNKTYTMSSTILSPIEKNGVTVTPVDNESTNDSGKETLFYLKKDEGIILTVANINGKEIPMNSYAVKYPLIPNNTWEEGSNAICRIESVAEEVVTNTATYVNCLHLSVIATLGDTIEDQTIIKQNIWYAPNLGMVKRKYNYKNKDATVSQIFTLVSHTNT